ncbi:BolA family transcriptional regulator [Coxiella endosymbiont of Rhipicephalus microplus]|uniref:BolA family protein n=1 Tax=Coxiella endosymbiont of Rhipicephalus microplus TaxID=1656186 RepID=UPI000CE5AE7F|nr:BolA family protein [Coxiella endosymbiont of Rhipicephalus microplus]
MSIQEDRIVQIQKRLIKVFHPEKLNVRDESHYHVGHVGSKEGKGHFAIFIVAKAFKNKSLLESHRMIYEALNDLIKTDIHALQIQIKSF